MRIITRSRDNSAAGSSHTIKAMSQPANTSAHHRDPERTFHQVSRISGKCRSHRGVKDVTVNSCGGEQKRADHVGREHDSPKRQYLPGGRQIAIVQKRQNRRQRVLGEQLLTSSTTITGTGR